MSTNKEFVIYRTRIAAIVTATRFQLCGDPQQRGRQTASRGRTTTTQLEEHRAAGGDVC